MRKERAIVKTDARGKSPHVLVLPKRNDPALAPGQSHAPNGGRDGSMIRWRPTAKTARAVIASFMILATAVWSASTLVAGFEAHVINVTATIDRPPAQCDARSIGYWKNHEGCFQGTGSSIWADQINNVSPLFSGAFEEYTGPQICQALHIPSCPPGGTTEGRLCRAAAHTLANELNLVSNHLDIDALIALADDGSAAFDRLGLSPTSTVGEALTAIEEILVNGSATKQQLTDAGYVSQRIYSFYEDENPFSPQCVFEEDQIPVCEAFKGKIIIENENEASVENDVDIDVNTGGNEANGGDEGGDGGTIETGNASTSVSIINEVNTNDTDINMCSDCEPCDTCSALDPNGDGIIALEIDDAIAEKINEHREQKNEKDEKKEEESHSDSNAPAVAGSQLSIVEGETIDEGLDPAPEPETSAIDAPKETAVSDIGTSESSPSDPVEEQTPPPISATDSQPPQSSGGQAEQAPSSAPLPEPTPVPPLPPPPTPTPPTPTPPPPETPLAPPAGGPPSQPSG